MAPPIIGRSHGRTRRRPSSCSQAATLRIGGVAQVVSTASLEKLWRGDYATFWRVPPGYGSDNGDGANLSPWIAEQLGKLRGGVAVDPADANALKNRIQAFQTAQGLKADGLAGPLTLMQLNRAGGVDEPRLPPEP